MYLLLNLQNTREVPVAPVAKSSRTLAEVLSQNREKKYKLAQKAIASDNLESLNIKKSPLVDDRKPVKLAAKNNSIDKDSANPTQKITSAQLFKLPFQISDLSNFTATAYLTLLPNASFTNKFIFPSEGVITSNFGWRWGRAHQGVDIAAEKGTPIWAASTGIVQYAGWNSGGYGNMVDVRHPDGTITRYSHLNNIYVEEGQTVSQAQPLGTMGDTGYTTGTNLHFEIRLDGFSAVDPLSLLSE
ncbi:M23 family metallopeptidase [Pseudanabaena sp. PCC 6802]|uniref:M23 family metallopeptidase n=1 Tax=Pseudanabaena sp. PCC 6802 TaxID=118173 RepID=UPI0003475F37|nr:M23 family metallopeptidase [Pseudanabaena sp. PCC 6802]